MKVYIQVYENGIPRSKNFAYAYYGFHEMGFEIKYFKRVPEINDNELEDVIVGFVDEIRYAPYKIDTNHIELTMPKVIFYDIKNFKWYKYLKEYDEPRMISCEV